jgi:hypothetical protein
MISLRPSLITEHHSVSSLNDLAREASPCSRHLRPARDQDMTYTVGGNCSRVDGDKRTERIGPPSDSSDASVDPTDARKRSNANEHDGEHAITLGIWHRAPGANPLQRGTVVS